MTSQSTPQPGRLQHRNTLEVPRSSTPRPSRDAPQPPQLPYSDEAILATGRFSPGTPNRRRGSLTLARRTTRSIHSELHLDDVPQDDEAARWAEIIRQKRASKRKRREEEEDDRVLMGTKVDQNHVNYVTAYNMLTGIRFTVSRTNAKLDRELTDADFEARHKFSFDVTGAELTPSAKYDFKFKDYAPWVFRRLRQNFKLDPADYLVSLTSKYILSELGSPGKSGSFFYFSRDYKYIIKTIHHAEHKTLRRMLKEYYNHVVENPNTLLSQFYGLHRVKIPYGRKIHFVVMNNLFPPHRDIHRTFDLKGSTVGRDFKEENLKSNPRATLKDLNWLRRNLHLEFGPGKRNLFIEQMERDVALLQRLKIMDYSLLVGIHDLQRGNEDKLRDKTLQVFQPGGDNAVETVQSNTLTRTPSKLETARKAKELRQTLRTEKPIPMEQTGSKMPDDLPIERKDHAFYKDDGGFRASHEDNSPGEVIYYLGIIDCLTHYGIVKRVEHFLKGLTNIESQISPIPPDRYGDRFVRFISGITNSRERAEQEMAENRERVLQSIDDPHLSGGNMQQASPTDAIMERAHTEADRSQRHGTNESSVPDRVLKNARGTSTDRGEASGYALPVVEEAVENQSTGGRSGRSDNPSPSPQLRPQPNMDHVGKTNVPPPTPPKDVDSHVQRPPTPPKDFPVRSSRPPTPPKDAEKVNLDPREKDLPPPPPEAVEPSSRELEMR
ncbi:SAICAR synthase-like protein [Trichodelitschia bisporula]|uniref:1-phosphatidylinositol-4-phosphate 5-kinase n=1 Tax=Trichodelitschia bisporula TaxID=703511 RepID=A0A6G1HVK0_9PEZI|nr:SAICAR synthase-like protein [Trichodelitschia bisporula]